MTGDGIREVKSFCRICPGGCGVRLKIDADDRILHVRGDDDQPMSKGYACFKGLQAEEAHHGAARLLRPLKRQSDGSFTEVGLEQALDEIAEKLRPYYEHGDRNAIAVYHGNGATLCSAAGGMSHSFTSSLGTSAYYTTLTIDQSAKIISFERLGGWAAGLYGLDQSDVALLFGTNPLVSHGCLGLLVADPMRRLKKAEQRGLKLIVVDPRKTETSRYASLLLQPIPGQDSAILGGLIRIVMDEGWGDTDFTERFATAEGLAALREAVDPFAEDYVEKRAGLQPGQLRAVAEMFARDGRRGSVFTGTGPCMAPHSNLTQHLADALNVVCGRFRRAGDKISVNMLAPAQPVYEEAISPPRSWAGQPRGRIRGVDRLANERLTATLAEEILTPGAGQVRCLLITGANPMSSMPDARRLKDALNALDLLVVIDPYMTQTAQQADYVLPPKMQYERADLPVSVDGFTFFPDNWTQYTPAVIAPPKGSEVCDEWYPFWAIAKRLGFPIDYMGKAVLPMDKLPTTDELLALRMKGSRISLEELRQYPSGHIRNLDDGVVLAGRPGMSGRFDLMPADVAGEVRQFIDLATSAGEIRSNGRSFSHLLSNRRLPYTMCSTGTALPNTRKRLPYNPAFLNPEDLQALRAESGDVLRITSDHGSILAVAESDATVRPGVVSLTHGFGGEPADVDQDWDGSANINLLIASDRDVEDLNSMPRMSAIPVNLERVNAKVRGPVS